MDTEKALAKAEEFKKICEPVVTYIRNNYSPHETVIITDCHAKIVSDKIGVPFWSDYD